jgi:hypothetical protein
MTSGIKRIQKDFTLVSRLAVLEQEEKCCWQSMNFSALFKLPSMRPISIRFGSFFARVVLLIWRFWMAPQLSSSIFRSLATLVQRSISVLMKD